ncbi:MAG: glycoside hydrolase family protein [Polyangiaceae bacterium]
MRQLIALCAVSGLIACSGSDDGSSGNGGSAGAGASGGAQSAGSNSGGAAATTNGGSGNSGGSSAGSGNGGAGGTANGGSESGGTQNGGTQNGGSSGSAGNTGNCKRGVAYGYHSEADMRALSSGVSWWYNWAFEPDEGVRSTYASIGLEYVPMVWGAGVSTSEVQSKAPSDSHTLLGFNEPNFGEQANLSAAQAAALWPGVQAVADARGFKLLSPAVNFCAGNCQETDPFKYLDDFFSACTNCRVDAIAVHIYVGCAGENGNHAQWMINHLKTYESRFTQPIWLTEFACSDAQNADEQRAFLVDAVTYLESDPRIERYAWFAGRADNVPHVDLLGTDGQLTALGQAYVDAPRACDSQ